MSSAAKFTAKRKAEAALNRAEEMVANKRTVSDHNRSAVSDHNRFQSASTIAVRRIALHNQSHFM